MKHITITRVTKIVLKVIVLYMVWGSAFVGTVGIHADTYSPLAVTCTPSATTAYVGQSTTWNATATGGNGAYNYTWSGSNNLTGIGSSLTQTYGSEGVQTATVRVTSGDGQNASATCGSVNVLPAILTGYCAMTVNPMQADRTYSINWNSQLFTNVATTTTYQWSGTGGLGSGSTGGTQNSQVTQTYTNTGTQTGTVAMRSGTQTLALACSATVNTHPQVTVNTGNGGTVVQSTPLSGSCLPSVNGMSVTWNASASGGMTPTGSVSPYVYTWTSNDGFATSTQSSTYTYATEGTHTATVTIASGDQSLALACQARIASTTSGTGHCFIATAAYGTPLEPEVQALRNFRDTSLETNVVGQALVDAYYTVSPPIADYIRDKEPLKAIVRAGLAPVVYVLEKAGYGE